MTLQRYLTRLVWLSALPLLALALWLGYARFAAERDSEDARAGRLAERLAQVLDHALQARISALQVLARSPLLHESRWPELHAAAAGFREGFGGEVMVVDAERRWRLHSSVPVGDALPTLPRPQGRSAVDVVFASGRPAVGDPFRGPVAQEPMVAIGVPVRRDDGVPLMLANVMPLRQLDSILNEPAIPAGWSAALRDSQGREIWARAGAGSPGPSNGDRETVLRYADDLSAAPWAVEVQIPRVTYVQHLAETGAWLLLTLVGVLTVSVLVGRWGRQRLARSVQTLVAADGPGWPADEIDEFRRARRLLEDTLAQRAAADDALKVREGQLRGIFETATEAIVTANADQHIVLANPAAARVFGRPLDELVGASLDVLIPARHRAQHREEVAQFGRAEAATRTMGHRNDVVGLRADGSEFPVEAAISQVHVDGQHLYTVILRDVTERRQGETALTAAKARLEAAIEGMRDGLVMIGTDGRIVEVNSAYARMYGFPDKSACVGAVSDCERQIDVETLDGRPLSPEQRCTARALRGETGTGIELRVRRRDGGRSWVGSFSFAPIHAADGAVLGAVVTVRDVTERLRLEQELQASHAELASLMTAQVSAEEGERRRIARELHDELQQVLAAIKMDAGVIEAELRADPSRVAALATRIDDLATAAIVSSRRIVNDLRPLLLEEFGLVAALRNLLRQFGERNEALAVFDEDPRVRGQGEPPEAVAICLYRVVQEALNNVAKHSGARRVQVALTVPAGGGWRLTITDDGRGMRAQDWRKPSTHGLRGMHERVRGLGGTLRIDGGSGPGRGVSLTIEFGPAAGAPPALAA